MHAASRPVEFQIPGSQNIGRGRLTPEMDLYPRD